MLKKTRVIYYLLTLVLIISLGWISSIQTFLIWDGLFPPGEYHLQVQNEAGDPIEGAALKVFDAITKDLAFGYPIDNYLSNSHLASNEQGVIVVLHKPGGIEFGGTCWNLFWIFPICSSSPEYEGEISADGYQTTRFSLDKLFDLAYRKKAVGSTSVTLEHGKIVEMPIYEIIFTLKK